MHCFLLAVSQASTLDRFTNNFSLFFLVEEIAPSRYPTNLQVHTHAFFEVRPDEVGREHEVRLAVTRDGSVAFHSDPIKVEPRAERHRVRLSGLSLSEPGRYRVFVEWRPAGGEWTREALGWPIKANPPLQ